MAAGEDRWLSDFSLRRNGDIERAVDIAVYAFIGGFNDTSNMEAAHRLDLPRWEPRRITGSRLTSSTWTIRRLSHEQESQNTSNRLHSNAGLMQTPMEQPCYSTQLMFTWARSTQRWQQLQPSSDGEHSKVLELIPVISRSWVNGVCVSSRRTGLLGLRPNLTGDLDVEKVTKIVAEFPEVKGFGIGTKLSSEVRAVAGVIFKQCLMKGQPTLKASNSKDKITLPWQATAL
jgi:hypothetical protein